MQIDPEEKSRVLRRLKKVLALTESSNPGEAAAALQQANTIMARYGFNAVDAAVESVEEHEISLSVIKPSREDMWLLSVVTKALGVMAFVRQGGVQFGKKTRSRIAFIGDGAMAEIAGYAFGALRMQLKRDIKKSFEQLLEKEYPDASQRSGVRLRPDQKKAYALSWCSAVTDKVCALAPRVPSAVETYFERRSKELNMKQASKSRPIKTDALGHKLHQQGAEDGKNVSLHQAVYANKQPVLMIS